MALSQLVQLNFKFFGGVYLQEQPSVLYFEFSLSSVAGFEFSFCRVEFLSQLSEFVAEFSKPGLMSGQCGFALFSGFSSCISASFRAFFSTRPCSLVAAARVRRDWWVSTSASVCKLPCSCDHREES